MRHAPRFKGETKYGLYYLLRTHFDLMTGFSFVPLQLFTLFGFTLAGGSFLLVLYLLGRRIFIGPEAEGVFTLFAILFFMKSSGAKAWFELFSLDAMFLINSTASFTFKMAGIAEIIRVC
jgi:hypothetical protein